MAGSIFNITEAKGRPKAAKAVDATEIAARNFVYKLFDATRDSQFSGRHCVG